MPSKRLLWAIVTGLCWAVTWWLATHYFFPDAIPGRVIQVTILMFFLAGGVYYFAVNLGGYDEDK